MVRNGCMKKIKSRTLIIGISVIAVTSTIILTSGILSTTPLINAAGSSAVQPLMVAFSNKYLPSDLVTQAGGSGAGIRAVIDGTKEIGMASKKPGVIKELLPGEEPSLDQIKWIKNEIKTVTIAWDGMGIVYKPAKKDTKIDINENTIKNLYVAFAGNTPLKYSDIGVKGDETQIHPYARSGGSVVSGTADAFYKDSNLKYEISPEEKKQLDSAMINGEYGSYTKTTSESNSQAWSFVKNENKIGSMVYLSAGFINNNREEIENEGFEIATYKTKEITLENISKGYDWFRPLNLMLSIKRDSNNQQNKINDFNSQELIEWIFQSQEAKSIIKNEGYVNLNYDDILQMCLKDPMTNKKDPSTFWFATDEDIFNEKHEKLKVTYE